MIVEGKIDLLGHVRRDGGNDGVGDVMMGLGMISARAIGQRGCFCNRGNEIERWNQSEDNDAKQQKQRTTTTTTCAHQQQQTTTLFALPSTSTELGNYIVGKNRIGVRWKNRTENQWKREKEMEKREGEKEKEKTAQGQ